MILAVNNFENRQRKTAAPQFKGVLDGALTGALRTLDTNEMANAVLIDLGAMVTPRTYYDTKERNKKSYELIPWNKRNKNIEDKKNNQSNVKN